MLLQISDPFRESWYLSKLRLARTALIQDPGSLQLYTSSGSLEVQRHLKHILLQQTNAVSLADVFDLQISDFRISGFLFQISDLRFTILAFRFHIVDFSLHVLYFRFQIFHFIFQLFGFQFPLCYFSFQIYAF